MAVESASLASKSKNPTTGVIQSFFTAMNSTKSDSNSTKSAEGVTTSSAMATTATTTTTSRTAGSSIDLVVKTREELHPLPYDYRSVITKRESSVPPTIGVFSASSSSARDNDQKTRFSKDNDDFGSMTRPSTNPFEASMDSRPIVNEIRHFENSSERFSKKH